MKLAQEQEAIALIIWKQILENVMEDLICEIHQEMSYAYKPSQKQPSFHSEASFHQ